jgi:hypothetical protein
VLTDVAVMLADGGEAISDLAVLRDQPGLFGSVASTATAWRGLDGVDEQVLDRLCARATARNGPGCCAPKPAARFRQPPQVAGFGPGWCSTWTRP